MLTFIFVLTIWTSNGESHVLVADYNMSGTDCIAAMENYVLTNPSRAHGEPSCEIDDADY